jgi:TM2 domain-containing membrane protein YozV
METTRPSEDWNNPNPNQPKPENKKIVAGILAILIGGIGIHKFILGYTKEGIIQIILSVVTCGIAGIVPFIEGIIYLTKSDDDFYQTYQVNKRPWF